MSLRRRAARNRNGHGRIIIDVGRAVATPQRAERPTGSVTDDPNYDWRKHDPKLADDVAGMVEEARDAKHRPQMGDAAGPDAAERERVERQEKRFLEALPRALTDRLQGSGLRCVGAHWDGTEQAYRVRAKDTAGRRFEALLTLDSALEIGAQMGEQAGRGMVTALAERLVAARAKYFSRMH